jgi:regulator of RNase E activity RraA
LHDLNIAILTNGSFPAGPRRLDRRNSSDQTRVSGILVDAGDVVFGDEDGVMFVRHADVGRVLSVADEIQDVERRQADAIRKGTALRTQLRFDEYLQARSHNDKYTLREHLQKIGGAVEV